MLGCFECHLTCVCALCMSVCEQYFMELCDTLSCCTFDGYSPSSQTATLDGYSFQPLEKDQFSFQATALSRVQVKVSAVNSLVAMNDVSQFCV